MSDESAPIAAPSDTHAPEAPAPATAAVEAPTAAAPAEAPTVRDHAERLQLKPWEREAVIRRMHGERDEGAPDVNANTRLDEEAFTAALTRALHGRV